MVQKRIEIVKDGKTKSIYEKNLPDFVADGWVKKTTTTVK